MTAIATAAPTVLIIDDEMGILDTIRILLKRWLLDVYRKRLHGECPLKR